MRIWHQSLTVLEDVPDYRDAIASHFTDVASPGTTIDLHGMKPGTYPSAYPGTHIGYAYLIGLHREQFIQAALLAVDEGYDAFLIGTLPDVGFEEIRSLVDIPVVTFCQSSLLLAATLGNRPGIVNFIAELEPRIRRNVRNYGLDGLLGPIVQVAAAFDDIVSGYAAPAPLIDAFRAAARQAIDAGADVVVPGEGPLNIVLAREGITRVDGVPVIDSLGSCLAISEVRVHQHQARDMRPARRGFHHGQPPRDLVDAARRWYGITAALDDEDRP